MSKHAYIAIVILFGPRTQKAADEAPRQPANLCLAPGSPTTACPNQSCPSLLPALRATRSPRHKQTRTLCSLAHIQSRCLLAHTSHALIHCVEHLPFHLCFPLSYTHTHTCVPGPGEVKPLRVSLLEAREQLDVFSFAFPNRIRDAEPLASAEVLTTWGRVKAAIGELLRAIVDWINKHVIDTGVRGLVRRGEPQQQQQQQQLQAAADTAYHRHKGRDLWLDMRADLDEGYEVLGDFQVCVCGGDKGGRGGWNGAGCGR